MLCIISLNMSKNSFKKIVVAIGILERGFVAPGTPPRTPEQWGVCTSDELPFSHNWRIKYKLMKIIEIFPLLGNLNIALLILLKFDYIWLC